MLQPVHFLRGRVHERARRFKQAQAAYQAALTGKFANVAEWHYRLGMVYFKSARWDLATAELRTAVALNGAKAEWHLRLAKALRHQGEFQAALDALVIAEERGVSRPRLLEERAMSLEKLNKWPDTEESLRELDELGAIHARGLSSLAKSLQKQGKSWQAVDALKRAVELDSSDPERLADLAFACEDMGDWQGAAAAFRKAIAKKGTTAQWHFRLGRSLARLEQAAAAQSAYASAISLDAKLNSKRFGVGAFHQQAGNWEDAAEAYSEELRNHPADAELHYRLGMAHDRCYRWQPAAEAYATAVALKPQSPSWHFRLGFALERQGEWERAAAAYEVAILQNPSETSWPYRLGVVLAQANLHDAACNAFLATRPPPKSPPLRLLFAPPAKADAPELEQLPLVERPRLEQYQRALASQRRSALKDDVSSAESHYLLGREFEEEGEWAAAATEYRAAVLRANTHSPEYFYRLGAVLAQGGRAQEACPVFAQMRIGMTEPGVPPITNESPQAKRRAKYAEFYRELPIVEDLVLYESFLGASLACNPLAIFHELRAREECRGWVHVWVIDHVSKIPLELRNLPDVCFVSRESDAYLRYLASARLLVNNVSFPEYFIRKPGQLYLNTWHGTPIKFLGKDIKEGLLSHKNVTRNFLHATHLVSPNPHTTRVLLDRYDVAGIASAVVAETGYPRVDFTLGTTENARLALRKRLGVPQNHRVVLYAPTWRGTHDGNITVDLERLEHDIRRLRGEGYTLLFRGHHMAEKHLSSSTLARCTVPQGIDTNVLLSVVDVLVTDYSSIVFDFLVLNRPIVYYAYDLEEYARQRGMYFPLTELPGEICSSVDEVSKALTRALDGELLPSAAAYSEAIAKYCPRDDGHASARVVDLVLHGKRDGLKLEPTDSRTSLLFFVGPLIPNGILSSWKNLVAHLDPNRYTISLVLEPSQVSPHEDRMREFEALPPHVRVIGCTNTPVATLEEGWIRRKFHAQHHLATEGMMERYLGMCEREYRRVFGEARFDCVVNFEGYNRTWMGTCARWREGSPRRVVFLHNDMLNEWKTRFPYLEGVFHSYRYYDVLASVSRLTGQLNEANLAARFSLPHSRFTYCENLQDPDRVIEMSQRPIALPEHLEFFRASVPKFITLGRLSPEKDHEKLIRAFARLHEEHSDAQLFILGGGPLRAALQALIESLGLSHRVFLLGHQANPFPYLALADCFVLSSNHEGQPMVLFEAMILKKPIVATNIVGARGVLEGRCGLLVENSQEGLLGGMRDFIAGKVQPSAFDNEEYQRRVLDRFASIVGARSA